MALVCTFAATNTAADYLAMTITSLLVLSSAASAVAEKKKERERVVVLLVSHCILWTRTGKVGTQELL